MTTIAKFVALSCLLLAAMVAAAAWYSLAVPGRAYRGSLDPLTAEETDLAVRLRRHVTAIASVPHNTYHDEELKAAAVYIEAELVKAGYRAERHTYEAEDDLVWNIEATIEPAAPTEATPSLVIGAHYDSAGDAPGANDNGSGVAALLEIARALKSGLAPKQRIRLVFFVNEEPPFFMTDLMGSRQYVALLQQRGEVVSGMVALETLGAFSDQPGSQQYPEPFHLILPNVGNFIGFVAMPGSRAFMHKAIGSFRSHTRFPTIGAVAPPVVQGADWSDHGSFAAAGIPALMITDTAVFRYAHYHRPTDTPDKVDYEKLARLTKGIERMVRDLAW
jgi:Zn-dependent M28 family amino/carboxypeptidase